MNDSNMDVSYQISRQKIILTGDVAVGKTAMINRLLGSKFNDEYEPSIGVDFFSKTLKFKGKQIKLQIWDSAGQEKFRSLIPNYIRGASLIFLLYDVTNKNSFNHLPDWIKFINNIENTNIVIIGNKIDLEDNREVTIEEGRKFAKDNNYEIFEISAKEGTGLLEMMISSVASLPIWGLLTNEKMSKEEIMGCLRKENYEEVDEGNISQENDEFGFGTENNKEKSKEVVNIKNESLTGDIDKNLYTVNNKKKGCC